LGVFLALLALALIVGGYFLLTSYLEEREARPFQVVKEWKADARTDLSVKEALIR
jgi:hypothetical protein